VWGGANANVKMWPVMNVEMKTVVVVLEAVVKEQVGQENDKKPVKRIEFQNEQVFHEYWTVPKVWNEEVK